MEPQLPKKDWGPGAWQEEPDLVKWVDPDTGYQCLAKRNGYGGAWCGYVGLSEGHKLYGKKYSDRIPIDDCPQLTIGKKGAIPLLLEAIKTYHDGADGLIALDVVINVHGSITWSDLWEDQNDGLWYIGFDCGHCDDYQPGMVANMRVILGRESHMSGWGTYRTLAYVQAECRSLAAQLKELAT